MTDQEFIAAFERQGVPRDDWTHEAHVRMTWLYARRASSYEATLDKVRSGIRALNAVNHVKSKLYHETVTIAFASIIRFGLYRAWPRPAAHRRNSKSRSGIAFLRRGPAD